MKHLIWLFFFFHCYSLIIAQYENERCKCICPSLRVVASNESLSALHASNSSSHNATDIIKQDIYGIDRKVYIDSVPPLKCNCDGLVLPKLVTEVSSKEFCPLCECRFESRNTEIIRYVIIVVITVILTLVAYMLILLLDSYMPWGRVLRRTPYREHINEEMLVDECPKNSSSESIASSSQPKLIFVQSKSVIGAIGHEQNKWKKKVIEQRKNIYDRHNMLN